MSIERLAIWDEVVEFLTSTPSPQQIVEFRPSKAMGTRLLYLVERSRGDLLTTDESAELAEHLAIENFMRRLKATALDKVRTGA